MKTTTLVVCLLFATPLIYSQNAIPASGGEATGSGSVSYSVRQLVYTTNTGSGTVTQGVQQSIELFTLSNPKLTALTLTAVTYPNPTTDYVVLALKHSNLTDLSYVLYDLLGRSVAQGNITEAATQIAMGSLEMGTYLLNVNQNHQALKSFKIIKN